MYIGIFAVYSLSINAQPDSNEVEITSHHLAQGLYFLEGQGGNIGVSVGDDGVFLVDDQFSVLTDKIVAAINELSDKPVKFVINTHYHGDHTGGNHNFSSLGAVIVAHENVRNQLAIGFTDNDVSQALTFEQKTALPIVTFTDSVEFHFNGESIQVFHFGPGHTDGDSFVHFTKANVIHTGDVFRTTGYPRVDGNANGSFRGIVASYEKLLEVSDEETIFLPGHGELSSRDDVKTQLAMFYIVGERIQQGIDQGMSLEQVQLTKPTAEFDDRWGQGSTSGEALVAVVFAELEQHPLGE